MLILDDIRLEGVLNNVNIRQELNLVFSEMVVKDVETALVCEKESFLGLEKRQSEVAL